MSKTTPITTDRRAWHVLIHTDSFSFAGAVTQLYDISRSYHSSQSLTLSRVIQAPSREDLVNVTPETTVQQLLVVIPALLFPEIMQPDHYFTPTPLGMGSPPSEISGRTRSSRDRRTRFRREDRSSRLLILRITSTG